MSKDMQLASFFAELTRQPQKYDCLKHSKILQLESLDFTPFHLVSLILFILAIFHTLSVHWIHHHARMLEIHQAPKRKGKKQERSILVQLLYFLSEVEVVFAFWSIPLFIAMVATYGWTIAFEYVNTRDYSEALFVTVLLALAATRPIVECAEKVILYCAKLLGGSLSSWWITLLTIGPILGSLITEVGAMILCAILLSRQFYEYHPSQELSYATLALLFVNISVGGILTDFASPAVLILSHAWDWDLLYMFCAFGWKAILGIGLANLLYWFFFRKELHLLNQKKKELQIFRNLHPTQEEESFIPRWIVFTHMIFIASIVLVAHYPAIFISIFILFLAFHQATRGHQSPIRLIRPMMVGLFLSGLLIHGGLQGWWVVKMLHSLSATQVLFASILMTGFNDNAAIAYLSVLVPNWDDIYRYALFTGVVAGGGLTVIANAPNPAGYALLSRHFHGGIKPLKLLAYASIPTAILYLVFYFLGPLFTNFFMIRSL